MPDELASLDALCLSITIERLGMRFNAAAEVRWQRREDSRLIVGCAVLPELPEIVFDCFASKGLLERRQNERATFEVKTAGVCDLGDKPSEFILRDYSPTGFCVFSEKPHQDAKRLHLCLDRADGDPVIVVAEVKWRLTLGDGALIGCAFLNAADYRYICTLVRRSQLAFADQSTPNDLELVVKGT
ncbi:MAG: PilZ domain-containing protein [Pirellulales bacterium]